VEYFFKVKSSANFKKCVENGRAIPARLTGALKNCPDYCIKQQPPYCPEERLGINVIAGKT
jgi:hypothetical protein